MREQRTLPLLAPPLEGSAELVDRAIALLMAGGTQMLKELCDPETTVDRVIRLKRALAAVEKNARSYALEAERELGRLLLGIQH